MRLARRLDTRQVSEDLLRAALDTLPIHVAVLDANGTAVAVNDTWNSFTEPHPFIGQQYGVGTQFLELCRTEMRDCPEEARKVLAGLREVLERRQQRFEMEYACPDPDGKERWFRFRALRSERGGGARIILLHEDITERKRAERELQERERLFRLMADTTPGLVWMCDAQRRFTYFNRRWLEFRGRRIEQERGRGWMDGIHPDDRRRSEEEFTAAFAAQRPFELEFRLLRADGEHRWLLGSGAPLSDPAGQFGGHIGSCVDVTDRRRAEEASRFLAEASNVLASSLDYQTTLGAVARLAVPQIADWCAADVLGADGSLQRLAVVHADLGKVELARELERRYSVDLEADRGLPNVLRTGYPELVSEITDELLAEMAGDAEHLRILRSLGLRSYIIAPLIARGRTLGALTLMTAESGRRYGMSDLAFAENLAGRAALAVDNARLYREAQDLNRMKDEFLATLSHELRTPLNAIVGWAHLLRDGKLDEETTQRAIETINRNAKVQNQLIADILDVSRIVTGKLRLNLRPVELPPIVESAVETMRPTAVAKGVGLETQIDAAGGLVSGDSDRLQQVVWNLLSNAIKFTPRGGTVRVRLGRERSHSTIVVEDTGAGMEPHVIPRIFERFMQGDSTSTRTHGGLGLGLAIVRHIVELHAGSVEASSRGPGQGSTFKVSLPTVAVAADAESGDSGRRRAGDETGGGHAATLEGLTVLVVDDHQDARELMTAVLQQRGARVVGAASTDEALELLRTEKPDVLLSDVEMPGEDGYALIRTIRALAPEEGGRVPAAALTAYARREDRVKTLLAGYQIHLAKPVAPEELVTVVTSLTGRSG
ncbi:MAG: two-component hybrid sensor and regulator [Acidobacteria bacterium]|nr:MAG: two-component hybrid sensor and regulator [Acidobacteriota bacterium]